MNAGHADLESNRVQHQHAEPVPIESRYASAGSHYMPESRSSRHMAATWSSDLHPYVSGYVLWQPHTKFNCVTRHCLCTADMIRTRDDALSVVRLWTLLNLHVFH